LPTPTRILEFEIVMQMIGTNSNNFFSRRGRSLKKKSIMKKTIGA
jgi:hypothetical protein